MTQFEKAYKSRKTGLMQSCFSTEGEMLLWILKQNLKSITNGMKVLYI